LSRLIGGARASKSQSLNNVAATIHGKKFAITRLACVRILCRGDLAGPRRRRLTSLEPEKSIMSRLERGPISDCRTSGWTIKGKRWRGPIRTEDENAGPFWRCSMPTGVEPSGLVKAIRKLDSKDSKANPAIRYGNHKGIDDAKNACGGKWTGVEMADTATQELARSPNKAQACSTGMRRPKQTRRSGVGGQRNGQNKEMRFRHKGKVGRASARGRGGGRRRKGRTKKKNAYTAGRPARSRRGKNAEVVSAGRRRSSP